MSRKIVLHNVNDLIQEHLSGKSIKRLAAELNISRPTLLRHFSEAGFIQRNRSEAMFTRMAQTTQAERQRLAKAANKALRGKNQPLDGRLKKAFGLERTKARVGFGENKLIEWLTKRGHECFWQKAVHVYNIDIAIPPVAVELVINTTHPMKRPFERRKIEYLTDHGWFVVYIVIANRGLFCEAIADYLHTTIELVKRNPSMIGQYWVIRGASKKHWAPPRKDSN